MSQKQSRKKGNKEKKEFRKFSPQEALAQMNEKTFLEKVRGKFKRKDVKPIKAVVFVQFALLCAVEAVFVFSPLGHFTFGWGLPASLAHLPPIIAAVFLGPWFGVGVGYFYGMLDFGYWATVGSGLPTAAFFSPFAPEGNFFSLLIAIVPRTFYPFIVGKIYHSAIGRIKKNLFKRLWAALAAAVGTLCLEVMLVLMAWAFGFSLGLGLIPLFTLLVLMNLIVEIPTAIITGLLCGNKIIPKYYNDD